jgi:hypothetical protein
MMQFFLSTITLIGTIITVVLIAVNFYLQIRVNHSQHKVNQSQNDLNAMFHARLINLERQLPTAENETQHHVH